MRKHYRGMSPENRLKGRLHSSHGKGVSYYFVKGEHNGRILVDGPHDTNDQAFQAGIDIFNGDTGQFSIELLPTRDKGTAMSHFKHEKVTETHNIDLGLRRGIRNYKRSK